MVHAGALPQPWLKLPESQPVCKPSHAQRGEARAATTISRLFRAPWPVCRLFRVPPRGGTLRDPGGAWRAPGTTVRLCQTKVDQFSKGKEPWINEANRSSPEGGFSRAACCSLWRTVPATNKQASCAQFSSAVAHRIGNRVSRKGSFARHLAFLRKAQPYQDTPLARCKSCVSKRLLCETPGLFGKGITL